MFIPSQVAAAFQPYASHPDDDRWVVWLREKFVPRLLRVIVLSIAGGMTTIPMSSTAPSYDPTSRYVLPSATGGIVAPGCSAERTYLC